jgi:hypothetical protein
MSTAFDAYHKWLGIPPSDSANGGPHHYRLLGLALFESDPDVIQAAADRQMAHVQTYKNGPQAPLSQKLLNEISAAKICLLKSSKKAAYDEQLRQQLGPPTAATTGRATNSGAMPSNQSAQPMVRPAQPGRDANGQAAPAQATPPAGANVPWRSMNPPGSSAFPAIGPGVRSPSTPNNGAGNSAAQTAAAHLAGRSATAVRPPAAPAAFTTPDVEQPQRSWVIPPAAAILAAASVVAVLLVIGIVLVLNQRGPRPASPNHSADDRASPNTNDTSMPPVVANVPPPSQSTPNHSGDGQLTANQVANTSGGNSGGFNSGGGTFGNTTDTHGTAGPGPGTKTPEPKPVVAKPPDKTEKPIVATQPAKVPGKTTDPNPLVIKTPTTVPPITTPGKTPPGKNADSRLPVPDESAIVTAETDLNTTAPTASVAELLQRVTQKPGAADAYVALRKALALSINDGDAIAALNIVDQLRHAYAVDDLEVRAQALTELRAKVREPAGCEAMGEAALALIDDAVAADKTQLAGKIAEIALASARRSNSNELTRKVTSRILKLRQDQPKAL